MAAWILAPAFAAGCPLVMRPPEQTPASVLLFMEIIGDLLPAGVVNIVNGYGAEAGQALASNPRIAKVAFTGSTPVGKLILHQAADNLIPATVELGGKSPNIYFADVLEKDDAFLEKAVEGLAMFALNQGEVCTCPSRILIQESIYDRLIEKAIARVEKIRTGNPLRADTMIGAQVSQEQFDRIMGYLDLGREEGATCLTGANATPPKKDWIKGFIYSPPCCWVKMICGSSKRKSLGLWPQSRLLKTKTRHWKSPMTPFMV